MTNKAKIDSHLKNLLTFVQKATGRTCRLRYSPILDEWIIEVLWGNGNARFGTDVQFSFNADQLDNALFSWEKAISTKQKKAKQA